MVSRRFTSLVTLLAPVSANLSTAAAADNKDAEIKSLPDAGIGRSLFSAIEAVELEEKLLLLDPSSDLVLEEPSFEVGLNDRELGGESCSAGQKFFKIDLTTTSTGSGTSWNLFRYDAVQGKWSRYSFGPTSGVYGDNSRYVERSCVDPASYAVVVRDSKGQKPKYSGYLKGASVFVAPSDFNGRAVHYFKNADASNISPTPPTRKPSPKPTPRPISPDVSGRIGSCSSSERLFTLTLTTDDHGEETSWYLKNSQGTTYLKNSRTYSKRDTDTAEVCLPSGTKYIFTIVDTYGDGLIDPGYYKVYVDGELAFSGGKNFKSRSHELNLVPQAMTSRDQDWLNSHNSRRQLWHQKYGKSYVPLKWSTTLKQSAEVWANELLKSSCGSSLYHDPDNHKYGENLASNLGTGSWGEFKSTDTIVSRFVEKEQNLAWPNNAHFTAVLWRPTKFVGCSDVAKSMGDNKTCRVQVCRYATAGNCDMSSFNNGSSNWWMNGVMQDTSRCGAECPDGGCPH